MNVSAQPDPSTPPQLTPEEEVIVKAAAAWINQLGRTLKTCRLYDGRNPTVVRFREDLGRALTRLLELYGPMTFRFTSEDVTYEGESLYPARSRDDNLALPFHRDGIRAITFRPGTSERELEAIVDGVLRVSGQNITDDDLVTLLWEAHLDHVAIDVVPAESDVGSGQEGGEEGSLIPWPSGEEPEAAESASSEPEAVTVSAEERAGKGRSDDWATGDLTVEIEAGFVELEALAPSETARFRAEYDAEHAVSQITSALAVTRAALGSGVHAEDRAELGRFVPRLLRVAVNVGAWLEAREALGLIRSCGNAEWSEATFAQELQQPISISTTVEQLDRQSSGQVLEFIALARAMGETAVDWLTQVLAESQQQRSRRMLAEAIADMCRDNPDRLAPWLTDRRWYVVRNVVHIMGWIGGQAIVGLLQTTLRHPEPRVRYEVIAALASVEPRLARPLLLRSLDTTDSKMFCAVLHQLSTERHPATARLLLSLLQAPNFEERPMVERRALYSALSSAAADEVVPDLEAELLKGNWFSRSQELHRNAVARCLARIGTPAARLVLERGILSKRVPVRAACEQALGGITDRE